MPTSVAFFPEPYSSAAAKAPMSSIRPPLVLPVAVPRERDELGAFEKQAEGVIQPREGHAFAEVADEDGVGVRVDVLDSPEVLEQRLAGEQVAAAKALLEEVPARGARRGEEVVGIDDESHRGDVPHDDRARAARGVGDEAVRDSALLRGGERLDGAGNQTAVLVDRALEIDEQRADAAQGAGRVGHVTSIMTI